MQENSVGNQPGKYQNNQGKAHTANNGEAHAPTLDPLLNQGAFSYCVWNFK
jgi:hypothetical protein